MFYRIQIDRTKSDCQIKCTGKYIEDGEVLISYGGGSFADIVNLFLANEVTPRTQENEIFNQRFGDGTADAKFQYHCPKCRQNCFEQKRMIVLLGSNDALFRESQQEISINPMKGVRKFIRMLKDLNMGKIILNDIPNMKNTTRNPNVNKNAKLMNRSIFSKIQKGWTKNAGWCLLEFEHENFKTDGVHLSEYSVKIRIRRSRVVSNCRIIFMNDFFKL